MLDGEYIYSRSSVLVSRTFTKPRKFSFNLLATMEKQIVSD